jgi:hypothetical protein
MPNVCMTKKSAVKEHSHLVKVLRAGGKEERDKEARDQASELKSYRKSGRKSSRR